MRLFLFVQFCLYISCEKIAVEIKRTERTKPNRKQRQQQQQKKRTHTERKKATEKRRRRREKTTTTTNEEKRRERKGEKEKKKTYTVYPNEILVKFDVHDCMREWIVLQLIHIIFFSVILCAANEHSELVCACNSNSDILI